MILLDSKDNNSIPKNRGLKNRTPLSSTLDNTLDEGLRELHRKTKVPISKLLDEAVEDLLKKRGER